MHKCYKIIHQIHRELFMNHNENKHKNNIISVISYRNKKYYEENINRIYEDRIFRKHFLFLRKKCQQ